MTKFISNVFMLCFVILMTGCSNEESKADWVYIQILQKMDSTANTLGRYTHSRFDNDSMFVKSQNDFSLQSVQRVLPVLMQLNNEYDSLLKASTEIDSLPKPSEETREKWLKRKKHLSFLINKEQHMLE